MAEVKNKEVLVKFTVTLEGVTSDSLYVVGDNEKLGAWEIKKAVAMKKVDDSTFTLSKKFPEGIDISFKFLREKDFETVEKGMFCEEIENHTVNSNDKVVSVVIYNFAK